MRLMGVPLKIAIFAFEDSPTVLENIVPRATERGHDVRVVRLDGLALHTPMHETLRELDGVNLVYYRTSGSPPMTAVAVAQYVRESGVASINCNHDRTPYIARKSFETYIAAQAGERIPKTLTMQFASYEALVSALGTPFVAKVDESSRGRGVFLIPDEQTFAALPEQERFNRFLYQEYIAHSWDYRVHIVGGKAVAMYKRIPKEGDFRANVSQGGVMAPVEEERKAELIERAEKLAPHFGLGICAIDYLCGNDSVLYFAEVNDNPGWEASDSDATGVDLTGITLDYFETLVAKSA